MDMAEQVTQIIEERRIVAIIRGNYQGAIQAMTEALIAGGVSIIEVTMNSAGVLDAIRLIAEEFGDRVLVGAGTVLEARQVGEVVKAGARFIVSPDTSPDVIHASRDQGVEPLPGALTPTEVMQGYRAGARLIKLFPAVLGGPGYLRQIRAPLDMVKFVPTGGIDASNARAYLDAGAVAVGLGSSLVRSDFDGSPAAVADLTARARKIVAAINPVVAYQQEA
jgi:2-dehydro-3-deoxyphosphogluconate aldolase/(4S)-4-hydroxy-2-oxoglutarate aldolase